jgi:hypothetical protein
MKETMKVWLSLSWNQIERTQPPSANLYESPVNSGTAKIANMVDHGWHIVDTQTTLRADRSGEAVTIYTLERDVTPPTLADRLRQQAERIINPDDDGVDSKHYAVEEIERIADEVAELEAEVQRLRAKQPAHRVIPQVNDGTPA